MNDGQSVHNNKVRYVVIDNHTLAYFQDANPWKDCYQILHASILKGATYSMSYMGFVEPGITHVRDATRADFDEFGAKCPPDFVEVGTQLLRAEVHE
jgi:hypothetical protein